MNLEQFMRDTLNAHKRIIKPWKKNWVPNTTATFMSFDKAYQDGWNDCLKEIEKEHKKFMAHLEDKIFSKYAP